MKLFQLYREIDETGISGTGIVAEGVQFTDGRCAMKWLTETSSIGIYNNISDLELIHGHGGKTVIIWEADSETAEKDCLSCNGYGR